MSAPLPILLTYDGEGNFSPASGHWARQADKHYVIGERYSMEPREDRSMAHHRSYFASVNEAWSNLPEELVSSYPSPDHLRRHAMIRAGFCTSATFTCNSRAQALKLAAFLRPMDEYSLVDVNGTTVTRFIAESQSVRAMGKERFKQSADAVLDTIAKMIGVERAALEQARAA